MPMGASPALSGLGIAHVSTQKTKTIFGKFSKHKFSSPFKTLSGSLSIIVQEDRIPHKGIKVRLEGNLEVQSDPRVRTRKLVNVFISPTETKLHCPTLFRGQTKFEYRIELKDEEALPTPFISTYGDLSYRVVAVIRRSSGDKWEPFAKQLIHFDGHSNINLNPSTSSNDEEKVQEGDPTPDPPSARIQIKEFEDISGMLSVSSGVLRGEFLNARVELQGSGVGVEEGEVTMSLSLVRKVTYGVNVQSDVVWEEVGKPGETGETGDDKEGEKEEKSPSQSVVWEWRVKVPQNSWVSFSNKFIKDFSVAYFLKYTGDYGEGRSVEDEIEIVVGTTSEGMNGGSGGGGGEMGEPSVPRRRGTTHGAHSHIPSIPMEQFDARRGSVVSMLSLLSLPPAYSALSSRSTSMLSLQTLPPHYDDI